MSKKPPKYKQLGLTKTKNGYLDSSGKYIPERQYRKMIGTPIKGSEGYKERKAAKERGEDFRATKENLERHKAKLKAEASAREKKFATKKGATSDWFRTGKEREVGPEIFNNREKHFKSVNKQRLDSIAFKERTGVITPKQAERLREEFREEHYQRNKLAQLYDKLMWNANTPRGRMFTDQERARLEKEYARTRAKYDKAHNYLDKWGIVPRRETELEHGYYH